MIAAVLAVVTSAEQTPTERLLQFMNNASQRGIAYSVKSGSGEIKGKFSYQLPAHQHLEIVYGNEKARFIQTPERIALFNDSEQLYHEYKSFINLISPPPDAGAISDAYPWFIWNWTKADSLKSATNDGSETIDGKPVDWIKQEIQLERGTITIRVAISKEGSPNRVIIQDPQTGKATFNFEQISWPFFDLKNWTYQPPLGYMYGTAPKMHRPIKYGQTIDFKNWGVDVAKLNKKGVAIIVSASGSKPDEESLEALTEMQIALDKLGVKTVEVHLDSSSAPKRPWPVTLDQNGKIMDQLDVPVTPYILFVNEKNMVISAWAGYAKDQRAKFVKSAIKAFNPPNEEE